LSAPYQRIVSIDFETRWDKRDYTLSKLTTEEYIRDKRFKAFGACIHEYGGDTAIQWYRGDELPRILGTYDWSKTAALAHNAQFDVSILEWRYGIRPAFIFDTLSMARALRGVEVGNSLAKLASDFGLPEKGRAVHSTDGLTEIDKDVESELADYCKHDVYLCERIFERLVENYPKSELRLIDMTLKMYTRPVLQLDRTMLIEALSEEGKHREGLLAKLGVEESELASNAKFADILRSMGLVAPTKVSKTTGKDTLALAKNDALFQALLNGENEDVRALCEARLKVKSTTERTRAQRFLDISQRGALPVPLSYYGAKSGRWTAAKGSAINMQNLKRGSFLRKAIMAPEGYQLLVGDLSQIEPRVLAWLSDYEELLNIFRSGQDAYAQFGAQMFGIPGMTKDSHPDLRQSAKSALLGCGYGLGWASFASQLLVGFLGAPPVRYDKAFAKKLDVTAEYIERFIGWEDNVKKLQEIPHTCTERELLVHCVAAKKIIDIYRATAHPVVSFWDMCDRLLTKSLAGGEEVVYKCLTFRKNEIVLPNGMSLLYPDLRQVTDRETKQKNWVYGEDETKLYAGKITNNVTQALARIVMTDGMLRTSKKYFVAGTVHDEQIVVVPDEEVADAKTWVLAQMTVEPKYMPGIPLAVEGGAHRRYGLAKK
jgi:DNA polymerase I-like protein with 3'-5' exonuclease and polymerase domains